jgi:hypothetical protein
MIPTGLPERIPFGIAPGSRHVVCIEWPGDITGQTFAVTLHDAHTGALVFTYAYEVDGQLTEHILSHTDTATLSTRKAYEVRVTRTTPGPDVILAGPVIFPPHTIPQAA